MWTESPRIPRRIGTVDRGKVSLIAAAILLAVLSGSARAQLVLENPYQRWRPGAMVELVLRDQELGQASRVEAVLFDDRPIPFEVLPATAPTDPIRIRIRVPDDVERGPHEISVLFADATAAVPDLTGLTLAEARRALARRGLELDAGGADDAETDVVIRTVTRQTPAAGRRVRSGSRVAVGVASRTEVPEIVGMTLAEARAELARRGLELEAPASPATVVVRTQDPPAGATTAVGTRIAVETAIPIPNLVGLPLAEARARLVESGLVPRVTLVAAADGPAETVLTQDPAAGTLAAPGVGITIAAQSRPDPPPPVWPWPWAVVTAALATTLGARVRTRRLIRRSFRVEAHDDLGRLRESTSAPPRRRGPRLDVRLVGHPDPGRQTVTFDGAEAAG